jgi:hypothetical protein
MDQSDNNLLTMEDLDSVTGGRIESHVIDGVACWVMNVAIGGQTMTVYAAQGGGPSGAVIH